MTKKIPVGCWFDSGLREIVIDASGLMIDYVVILGLFAGTLTTIAYVPEALRVAKTKSTKSLSAVWLELLLLGMILWLIYGFAMNSVPLIASNAVSILLVSFLLIMKIEHK